ncbi:hypothetical protein EIK77_009045 [Talaromyces pinophilus]|nr:hypothetical protein EIK77_009045 [Talaromyces pinophilus]
MIWQDMVPINVRSLLKSPPRRRHPSRVFDIVPAWSGKLTGNVQVVILDEAHKIKNPSSQSHSSIRELHARFYVLRSATPMIKDAFDLKTLFDIILKQEMNKEWNKSSPTEQDENLFLQSECRSEYIQNPPDIMQGINNADNTNSIIILPEYLLPPTDRTTESDVEDTTINELNDHNDNAGENENNNTLGRLSNTRDHVGHNASVDGSEDNIVEVVMNGPDQSSNLGTLENFVKSNLDTKVGNKTPRAFICSRYDKKSEESDEDTVKNDVSDDNISNDDSLDDSNMGMDPSKVDVSELHFHIPTLAEGVAGRKGKRKEHPAVEEAASKKPRATGIAGSSKWTVTPKAWDDAKVPIITHELGHRYRQRLIIEDTSYRKAHHRYELVETVYVENPDKNEKEQANTDEAGLAEGLSQ